MANKAWPEIYAETKSFDCLAEFRNCGGRWVYCNGKCNECVNTQTTTTSNSTTTKY